MSILKQNLHRLCIEVVQQRVDNAKQGLKLAEESAEGETKSSAGDKYETSREMMQQEQDRAMAQLNEANKLLVALQTISITFQADQVQPGSVVTTNNGSFYLAVSAGTITFDGASYFAVSPASPIGIKLTGRKKGESFDMNGKAYTITQVI